MKLKIGEVVNSVETLRKVLEQSLPVKISFRLMGLVKTFDEKLKTFEEARIVLIKRLGQEDSEGTYKIKEENMDEFVVEFQSLLSEEIEIDFKKIDVETLPDSVELSVSDIQKLEWMFGTD